jgi:hypothetical protein
MVRSFLLCLVAGGSIVIGAAGGANAESFTTRIEPRPFYGAVVTLEEGVRVIRPLPPVRQVIINPNNTPLSLGFNDTRVYERSENYNYNATDNRAAGYNGVPIYSAPFFGNGRGFGRFRGRFRHFNGGHGGHGGHGGSHGR